MDKRSGVMVQAVTKHYTLRHRKFEGKPFGQALLISVIPNDPLGEQIPMFFFSVSNLLHERR